MRRIVEVRRRVVKELGKLGGAAESVCRDQSLPFLCDMVCAEFDFEITDDNKIVLLAALPTIHQIHQFIDNQRELCNSSKENVQHINQFIKNGEGALPGSNPYKAASFAEESISCCLFSYLDGKEATTIFEKAPYRHQAFN